MFDVVVLDCVRTRRPAIPPLVRSDHSAPSGRECWELMAPRVRELWEAVGEHHRRTFTGFEHVQVDAVRCDGPLADFGHAGGDQMSVRSFTCRSPGGYSSCSCPGL